MKQLKLLQFLFLIISLALCIEEFDRIEFINKHLKDFNSPLMAQLKKDGSIGLFARKKISKNSPILKLPESMTLSSFDDFPRSYFFYEMGGKNQIDMLAGHLLYMKYLEKGSWNHNYFVKYFNEKSLQHTAGFWSDEDYKFFQSHIGYFAEHRFDLKEYKRKLLGIIANNEPHLSSYKPEFPEQMFELNELLWSYAMISKYSIPMTRWQWFNLHGHDKNTWRRKVPGLGDNPEIDYSTNIPGFVLIPFLDLISYESIPFTGKYKLSKMFQLDSPEVESYFKSLGIPDPKTAEIDITGEDFEKSPLIDLLYFDNPGLNEIKNLMKFEKRKFTLLANKNYQKGEEIRYLRNTFSNHDYLMNAGTLVPQNYFDSTYFSTNFPKFSDEHLKFCYEVDCAPENTTEFIYRFHRFQANHKFIKFLRILILVEDKLRGEGETPNPFDLEAARRVFSRGYFNSPFREILVWKYYFDAIKLNTFRKTTIVQDRKELEELPDNENNQLRRKMLMNGIQEKEIVHRHLQFSLQKYSSVMLNKLLLGQIKMHILGLLQKPVNSQPGFFTYSPLE